MIQPQRIKKLNDIPVRPGKFVVYWMQQSQRNAWNHALEYAIERANGLKLPLIVFFGLTETFPGAHLRQYQFMLEGLRTTEEKLKRRGIKFVVQKGSPDATILPIAGYAALVVVDKGYVRIQRQWRAQAAQKLACPLIEVESDVVVPVETALDHEAYSAAVIRPHIQKNLLYFLAPLSERKLRFSSLGIKLPLKEPDDLTKCMKDLSIDRAILPVTWIRPGEDAAQQMLKTFITEKLDHFSDFRNDPSKDYPSNLSPYLHFGQISALQVALEVMNTYANAAPAFLEELVVRRELAVNFVQYNDHYDSFDALPIWAQKTLQLHQRDNRPYSYSLEQLEQAETHDHYWNAAQTEMLVRGKMHGYMRMYWGKKIIEWTPTAEEAFERMLYLNNNYFIDGRDPNGFAGIAWCFGKHDRPWAERPTFGMVRYMNDKGLKRKFDMDSYVSRIERE
jgi:deoxyribodipyrimidine photo-lyase